MIFARLAAVLGVCFAAGLSGTAHAEPTAQDLASARELFKEGRAAREQGDLPKALEKLRAAHALGQTPITGIELARTYVLMGRLVDAREISLGVARLPVASDETDRSASAREEAARLATELEPRLAKLVLTLTGLPPGSTAVVTVDGERVPLEAIGEPRRVDPGEHAIVVTLQDGGVSRAQVTLTGGETRVLAIDASAPAPPPRPPEAPATTPAPAAPPPPPERHHSNAVLVAGAVTAGVGALVGVSFGVLTLTQKSSLVTDCPGGRCGPQHYSELDNARTDGTIATVGFVVAGIGVGAVALDLLLRPKRESAHASLVTPDIGPGWLGAHGSF